MSSVRLSKVTKELNISLDRAVEELAKQGHDIPNNRNHKITDDQYGVLRTTFADDLERKKLAEEVTQQVKEEKETLRGIKEAKNDSVSAPAQKEDAPAEPVPVAESAVPVVESAPVVEVTAKETSTTEPKAEAPKEDKPVEEVQKTPVSSKVEMAPVPSEVGGLKVMGKIDLEAQKPRKKEKPKATPKTEPKRQEKVAVVKGPKKSGGGGKIVEQIKQEKPEEVEEKKPEDLEIKTKYVKIDGPRFTGQKIVLPVEKPKVDKKKRKRIKTAGPNGATPAQVDPKKRASGPARGPGTNRNSKGQLRRPAVVQKKELTDEQIQKQIKETLEKLTSGKKNKGAKIRRDKRAERRERDELKDLQQAEESKILKLTEFVTVTELANMMLVTVNEVIAH